MGSTLSSGSDSPNPQSEPNTQPEPDFSSYVAACQLDPDVQIFDTHLHQRATRAINSIADQTLEVKSLSFDSLKEVTGCLIDMNQEVSRVILQCRNDIWNNPDLFALVNEYFDYSIQSLDFFGALDKCLKRARDRHVILQVALAQFEDEMKNEDKFERSSEKYAKTLKELKNFKDSGDPFSEEFMTLFQSIFKQQVQMFERLQVTKRRLDKKLKSLKVYRKVSNIIFVAAFVGVLVCSVVAAAIAAPPVVSALAAAVAAPMGGIGKWVNSLWKKYEKELKSQGDLISRMQVGTYIAICDLESIRVLVDKLEVEIESFVSNVELAERENEAIVMVIEEMRKKMSVFMEGVDELAHRADKYSREISRARTVILQNMIKS